MASGLGGMRLSCAIVGTNFISDWCVQAMREVEGIDPVAVVSRREETALEFAGRHGIEPERFNGCMPMLGEPRVWFESVEDLLQARRDGDVIVDALYIASPNALHAEQASAALRAGLHVLCEKVLGVGSEEAQAVLDAATESEEPFLDGGSRSGPFVLEEVRPLHDHAWRRIRDALPSVGPLRRLAFEKCQYSSRYDAFKGGTIENAFNPELGNSALADIGVYAVQPALWLLGTPESSHVESVRLDNGFDAAGVVTLTYPGVVAECAYSKVSSTVRPSVIEGEDGSILIDSIAEPRRVELKLRSGESRMIMDEPPASADSTMVGALETFVAAWRGEVDLAEYHRASLDFAAILDQVVAPRP